MKNILFYCTIVLFAITGCTSDDIEYPGTQVVVDKVQVKVGELVKFNVTNSPDMVTFYSGELGKKYEDIDKINVKASLMVSFESFGTWSGSANEMALLYSSDFVGIDSIYSKNGILDDYLRQVTDSLSADSLGLSEEVIDLKLDSLKTIFAKKEQIVDDMVLYDEATWTEIEGVNFGGDNWDTKLAEVDLSELSGQKVTLNFRRKDNINHGNYYIKYYKIMAVNDEIGAMPYIDLGAGYYNYTPGEKSELGEWIVEGGEIKANEAWPWWEQPMEHYLLMAPINLDKKEFPVQGARGVTIKGLVDKLEDYEYSYAEPGVYEATFIFMNSGEKGKDAKEVIQSFEITVVE
ncbi:MAG: DUF5017 domain-containing protein [Marinilabiliaceae bacterium]|nr:DUF5017 domain-containing protein [Marinilabiliaceae bacterium]